MFTCSFPPGQPLLGTQLPSVTLCPLGRGYPGNKHLLLPSYPLKVTHPLRGYQKSQVMWLLSSILEGVICVLQKMKAVLDLVDYITH